MPQVSILIGNQTTRGMEQFFSFLEYYQMDG